jgi:histidyl-tRNA synthetase
MPDLPMPRGVNDLLPNAALFRNEVLAKIERVFQRYGFLSIDTPMIESLKILKAKGGIGDESKLIFELKDDELGLRYDQTVSLARYINMHQELPLPFKRYAIGKCWRREEPQHMRYREFTQADVDIVGGNSISADAEVIATAARALEELNFDYIIKMSNRAMMDAILKALGVKSEITMEVMRSIDKLDKVGRDKVVELLLALGIERDVVTKIDNLISMKDTNEEKLNYVSTILTDKQLVEEFQTLLELLKSYNLKGAAVIDFSIVRGLDYYTGIVFEYADASGKERGAFAGGGRYDTLIGLYGTKQMPAVGVALGIDRILDLLGYTSSIKYTYARLFIINVKETNYKYALETANWFRSKGVSTDLNIAVRNISNQLSYANTLKFAYAAILGDVEEKAGNIKLRNLISGEEVSISKEEALTIIQKDM